MSVPNLYLKIYTRERTERKSMETEIIFGVMKCREHFDDL